MAALESLYIACNSPRLPTCYTHSTSGSEWKECRCLLAYAQGPLNCVVTKYSLKSWKNALVTPSIRHETGCLETSITDKYTFQGIRKMSSTIKTDI